MQDLKVIGVESGSLLLASEAGERFRIPMSEISRAGAPKPEAALPAATPSSPGRRVSPKEIQTHIRAGMSAAEVAAVTGADLSYVERFEGPVLAEREYVVDNALAVPVHSPLDTGPLGEGSTFGVVIRQRLAELDAVGERWTSWKQPTGDWIVKLSFTSSEIDHDARWTFDAKRQLLAPMNSEANTLSQQGQLTGPLIPRLRALDRAAAEAAEAAVAVENPRAASGRLTPFPISVVSAPEPDEESNASASGQDESAETPRTPDTSRFDSGAFAPQPSGRIAPVRIGEGGRSASSASAPESADDADETGEDAGAELSSTDELPETLATMLPFERRRPEAAAAEKDNSDLLDSLRRRRGQREPAPRVEDDDDHGPSSTQVIDIPLDGYPVSAPEPASEPAPRKTRKQNTTGNLGRRGRASMPSWDEIVFGTKTDDDPA